MNREVALPDVQSCTGWTKVQGLSSCQPSIGRHNYTLDVSVGDDDDATDSGDNSDHAVGYVITMMMMTANTNRLTDKCEDMSSQSQA